MAPGAGRGTTVGRPGDPGHVYRHRLDYGLATLTAAGFAADVELAGFVGISIGVLALLAVAYCWRRGLTAVAELLMAAWLVPTSFA